MADLALPYYLARPTGPVTAGVVVIHEGNGMGSQLLRVCERLAGEGYAAIAPDLFFRSGGPEAAPYQELIGNLDMAEVLGDLTEAAEVLRGLGATKVGVTGFCMGGKFTWHAAVHGTGFDAAVGFYGSGIAADLGEPTCPTLLLFGGSDPWIPMADIEAVQAHHADTVVYPQANHGFFRDGSDTYDPEAASDAWARTLAHFRQHLS
jgi:carboxymethylenebutenolidase